MQRKFLNNLTQGMTAKEAALKAGYKPSVAHNAKENIVDSPVLRDRVKTILDQAGIGEKELGDKHHELRNASELQNFVFPLALTDEEIETIVSRIPGAKLVYIKNSLTARRAYFTGPDNETQKAILDMEHKLRGDYAPDKHEVLTASFGELMKRQEELARRSRET